MSAYILHQLFSLQKKTNKSDCLKMQNSATSSRVCTHCRVL